MLVQLTTRRLVHLRRPTVFESLERRCLLAATAGPAIPTHVETTQPVGQVTLHLESEAAAASFALPSGALSGNPQLNDVQRVGEDGYQKSSGILSRSGHDTFVRGSNVENGADPPATLDFDDRTSYSTLSLGHDAPPTKMAADEATEVALENAESRPAVPLALGARLQSTAIQLTGTILRTVDDANAQRIGEEIVSASSTIGQPPTLKANLNGGAAGGSSQAKSTGAAADAWDSFETRHDTVLDAVALAATAHRLLRHIAIVPTSEPLAATPPETGWASEWKLALPLTPRLSIDAERLGQALEAVLADIEELGGQLAGSLIEGDHIFWALLASGMACYVAGARFQGETAAVSPTPRNERVPPRRLRHDGSTRYLVAQ